MLASRACALVVRCSVLRSPILVTSFVSLQLALQFVAVTAAATSVATSAVTTNRHATTQQVLSGHEASTRPPYTPAPKAAALLKAWLWHHNKTPSPQLPTPTAPLALPAVDLTPPAAAATPPAAGASVASESDSTTGSHLILTLPYDPQHTGSGGASSCSTPGSVTDTGKANEAAPVSSAAAGGSRMYTLRTLSPPAYTPLATGSSAPTTNSTTTTTSTSSTSVHNSGTAVSWPLGRIAPPPAGEMLSDAGCESTCGGVSGRLGDWAAPDAEARQPLLLGGIGQGHSTV